MFVKDRYNLQEYILSRGFGKSTTINTSISVWASCYKKSKYTCIIGKTSKLVEEFIDETKHCFEFKKIIKTFGILINTRKRIVNKEELELDNDTKIQGFTWGGTIRGAKYRSSRVGICIVDDVIKEDDILSPQAKEKVVNKFYKEVLPSGDTARIIKGKKTGVDSKFIVIGTPLANDDFINTVKNDSTFRVFHRGVCDFDVDKYFANNEHWLKYRELLLDSSDEDRIFTAQDYYFNNEEAMRFETVWEGKYKCNELANTYFTKRTTFMQELMCDCSAVGETWITNMAQMKRSEIEDRVFEKTILSIDQATSNTKSSDYTAFTVLGKSNGFLFVRDGILNKYDSVTEFDKYINDVLEMLIANKDIIHVSLEKNVYKGVDATRIEQGIEENPELRSRRIEVSTIYNTKNKDARIMTITDKINSGQVIFNEENEEYNKQVFDFKGQLFSMHDDAIDSLEQAINKIDEVKVIRPMIVTKNYFFE